MSDADKVGVGDAICGNDCLDRHTIPQGDGIQGIPSFDCIGRAGGRRCRSRRSSRCVCPWNRQHLSDADQVGVGNAICINDRLDRHAITQGDGIKGVTRLDGVVGS